PSRARFPIEPGSSHCDGARRAARHLPERLSIEMAEVPGGARLAGIEPIDQVMRYAAPFLFGRLGRADLQIAINLPAVDRDDLQSMRLGEQERDRALPHRGRPSQEEQRRTNSTSLRCAFLARSTFGDAGAVGAVFGTGGVVETVFGTGGVVRSEHGTQWRPKRRSRSWSAIWTNVGRPCGSPCGTRVAKSWSTRLFISSRVSARPLLIALLQA